MGGAALLLSKRIQIGATRGSPEPLNQVQDNCPGPRVHLTRADRESKNLGLKNAKGQSQRWNLNTENPPHRERMHAIFSVRIETIYIIRICRYSFSFLQTHRSLICPRFRHVIE
jgi:hypothetical protein